MPRPQKVWSSLVEDAGDAAVDDGARVSVKQAEWDLIAGGFDVKVERARAGAIVDALVAGEEPASSPGNGALDGAAWVSGAPPASERRPGARRAAWLVAALVAAATAGGVVYVLGRRSAPPDRPVEPPTVTAPIPVTPAPVTPTQPHRPPAPPAPPPREPFDPKTP